MEEEHKQCEYDGCERRATLNLYQIHRNLKKRWIQVCDKCERIVAAENIKRAGGKYGR